MPVSVCLLAFLFRVPLGVFQAYYLQQTMNLQNVNSEEDLPYLVTKVNETYEANQYTHPSKISFHKLLINQSLSESSCGAVPG